MLDKKLLADGIFDALSNLISDDIPNETKKSTESTIREVADNLSDAIDEYIKEAKISVETAGSTDEGTRFTGTGEGTIS